MAFTGFHPAVQDWFSETFREPTEVQSRAWESIASGQHTLLAAPTGSGKTLAAFLAVIDALVKTGQQQPLQAITRILYISPLKALSNDIQINLQQPLDGIRLHLLQLGMPDVDIQAWVRTGDTPTSERQKANRNPPHILVSTPESVYILLTSESGRKLLSGVETVIVDEIHALAGDKRGLHLSLSLERLELLCGHAIQRIGLSATQKPISDMVNFLIGDRKQNCVIVDTGHHRARDLALWVPGSPLQALMSNEVWQELYDQLETLVLQHRSTLVFVNTRRLAERAARFLAERLGDEHVLSHHGSMAKEKRLEAEQRLKKGSLKCLVATASLELGIDIGDVDLVCQIGSPRSIAVFLQRVGRSGHAVQAMPKGRIFPTSRDELVECAALLHAADEGVLDRIIMPESALDILAQQIVAEVANQEYEITALFRHIIKAWPYRHLSKQAFETVIKMLAEGFSTRRGRRSAYIHYDAVNGRVRPRQGARLTALTNGGAIPDLFDYDVILTPDGLKIGTLNEDFSIESMPGDIFQLGNISYRILKIEMGKVFVADAKGEPPTIPFWFGEAPGRTDELSLAVSALRQAIERQLQHGIPETIQWSVAHYQIPEPAAQQLVNYLAEAHAALGALPTQQQIIFERFMDEVGDMHLVIHSTFGSRLNRAWGLALRKRFCRKFNFELQAAALEDTIILSLSATHSFPLHEVASYLQPETVTDVLTQALLDAPMFATRWRWNATIALAVKRFQNGKRSPPYFQRADAEDLVAVIFPDQLACLENIPGNREIPDHPLVQQTLSDCLHVTMDSEGLESLLCAIKHQEVKVICRDLSGPSPLAQEVIKARPYAFLDDAPAEERRTLAISSQQFPNPQDASQLAEISPEALKMVRDQAWPLVRNVDECHDALMLLGYLCATEIAAFPAEAGFARHWRDFFCSLQEQKRALALSLANGAVIWLAVERLHEFLTLLPPCHMQPVLSPLPGSTVHPDADSALTGILRSRLECLGPVTDKQLAASLNLSEQRVMHALSQLEQQGFIIQGVFDAGSEGQWCERQLLARIRRYTIKQKRKEITAVSLASFMRFLCHWQGLDDKREGQAALLDVITQLQGFSAAAAAWEQDLIGARISRYSSDMLDNLCSSGQISWLRLSVPKSSQDSKRSLVKNTPICLMQRGNLTLWQGLAIGENDTGIQLSASAQKIADLLEARGALFFSDLLQQSGLMKTHVEEALGELVNKGRVTSDFFAGCRALITPPGKRIRMNARRGQSLAHSQFEQAGRWSLISASAEQVKPEEANEFFARILLRRYGIVFRSLLQREDFLPPWRDLLHIFWRLEARGEIRGGRFVEGISGEQFALPEALSSLQTCVKQPNNQQLIAISAADPLNLIGVIFPGAKISAGSGHRILLQDGMPVAVHDGKQLNFTEVPEPRVAEQAHRLFVQQFKSKRSPSLRYR